MRVLFISNFYPAESLGGVELYTHDLAIELNRRGQDVHVLCAVDWGHGQRHFNGLSQGSYSGIPVTRLRFNWVKASHPFDYLVDNPESYREVTRLLLDFKPDVVHITSCQTLSASCISAARELDIPVVLTLADYWFICPRISLEHPRGYICNANVSAWECTKCLTYGTKFMRLSRSLLKDDQLARLYSFMGNKPFLSRQPGFRGMVGNMKRRREFLNDSLSSASAVLAISPFLQQVYYDSKQIPDLEIKVDEWGIPGKMHTAEPKKRRVGQPIMLAYFGRIAPLKGVDILISACKKIGHDFQLNIYGAPTKDHEDYYQELKAICEHDQRIHFKGAYMRDEMPDLLAKVDLVVVPSTSPESYNLVIREAVRARVPVIASKIGALPDAVKKFECGWLVDPGNVEALYRLITDILDDPAQLTSITPLSSEVRTIQTEVDELQQLYESLVTENG